MWSRSITYTTAAIPYGCTVRSGNPASMTGVMSSCALRRAVVPELATRERRGTVLVDRPVPVLDEVVEAPIVALHVENEIEHAARPGAESRVAGLLPEVEEEDHSPGHVVDAGDALVALVVR